MMQSTIEMLECRWLLSSAGPTAGSLDPTFGTAGTATLHIAAQNNTPADLVTLPDGGALVLTNLFDNTNSPPYVAVLRTRSDGTLDPTFGQNGMARLAGTFAAHSMALTPDGRILVAGNTLSSASITSLVDLVLERINPDGSVDTSFGSGGMVSTDVQGRDDIAVKVLTQPDGKIVVAGYDQKPFLPGVLQLPQVFAVRYDAQGELDPTFGAGGKVVTAATGYQAVQAASAAIQSDGKIVVVGNAVRKEGDGFMVRGDPPQFLAIRYNTDGSLDQTFAGNGIRVLPSTGMANDVWVAPGGKIYAAGGTTLGTGDFALLCFNSNGALDTRFGTRGIASAGFERLTGQRPGNDSARRVIRQSDGKLLLVGTAGGVGIGVARFKPNGRLDAAFGSRGLVLTGGLATNVAVAGMQDDGRLIAGTNSGTDILLARYVSYTGAIAGTVREIPTVMSPPVGPMSGWTLYLDMNRNSRRDRNEPTTLTDASGKYGFGNLAPGAYRVAQVFPAGWGRTPRMRAAQTVRVAAATVEQPIDFAVARLPIPRHHDRCARNPILAPDRQATALA